MFHVASHFVYHSQQRVLCHANYLGALYADLVKGFKYGYVPSTHIPHLVPYSAQELPLLVINAQPTRFRLNTTHLPHMLTSAAALLCVCLATHASAVPSFALSSGLTSDMVLQRAPSKAAVYGTAPLGADVVVSILSANATSPATAPSVRAENLPAGAFKAYLQPMQAGGVYTITVSCKSGCNVSEPVVLVLQRVTFGDVFFCSGQSNMQLPLHYTYEADMRTAQVLAGRYGNIRTFLYEGVPADVPTYATQVGNVSWYNITHSATLPPRTKRIYSPFHEFSATCLHFAFSLVDETDESVPIGLIQSAVGGTRIEQWLDNSTFASCAQPDGTGTKLYYGMVTPFVNTSVTGWLWYQGENNCAGIMGNSATSVGYGCFQVGLVDLWRRMWSVEPGTTSPTASFGLVTLAAGGSEGHGQHMSHMRWSQTANYGVLPNEKMPNTYLAQGFDIGDPWAVGATNQQNCSKVDPATGKYGPSCLPWDDSTWLPSFKPMYPYIRNNTAPVYMGPIHPRIKHPVGQRLARAYKSLILGGATSHTGPTIAGCTASTGAMELRFNTTLLKGDTVMLQGFNLTGWSDSNGLLLCDGGHPLANASICACSGWTPLFCNATTTPPCNREDNTYWYCEEGPGVKPLHTPEMQGVTAEKTRLGWRPSPNPYGMVWTPAAMKVASAGSVSVDTSALKGSVLAVRYGWNFNFDTCCPDARFQEGFLPCTPGACPLVTTQSELPGNPFFATIEDNKCKCMAPQVCDG